MQFHSQLLPNGRFGIYAGTALLATIGCPETCQKMMKELQKRQLPDYSLDKPAQAELAVA